MYDKKQFESTYVGHLQIPQKKIAQRFTVILRTKKLRIKKIVKI